MPARTVDRPSPGPAPEADGHAPLVTARVVSSPAPDLVSVALDGAGDASTFVFNEVVESSSGSVQPGGTLSSAPSGTKASAGKLVFKVTSPVAGTVGFVASGTATLAGYRTLGTANVTAPAATVDDPLRIAISIDVSSVASGLPLGSVVVLRDGAVAGECTSQREAKPDPCIVNRARDGNELTMTVLTSKASAWTAARPAVQRVFGDTRILSAIAASRGEFADKGADAVVLVRSDAFADALAATPLAVAKKAPLLLTAGAALDDATLAEITRVLPAGKTVYLLGGVKALSDAVAERLASWGYSITRYFGANRFQTALVVAQSGLGSPSTVILTNGNDYGDALAAGAVAAKTKGAVLLTDGAKMPGSTLSYLTSRKPVRFALGGPAAKADRSAVAVVGADRYETSVLAAMKFFTDPATIGVVSGKSFADALSGGVHIAMTGGPLLAAPPSGALPISTRIYLRPALTNPPAIFVYGGVNAVGDDVALGLRREITP
ncbi:MAG: cell wall-binding repeat-containing protein [Acidobacteria bacterium]|nr:cell wall-binding repeat-containing protein [Acidobacteriota bacterium]